jgi:hypothetical protein
MNSTVTREQFASAVSSAISSIHHLYREVDRLVSGLREHLAEEPNSLTMISGTFSKGSRDQARLIVRNEYGALFGPAISDDEASDEDEEEIDEEGDEAEDEDGSAKRKRTPAQIAADEPLLGVRVVMYDPQKRDSFEPQIQYAIMAEWTAGKKPYDADQRFVLRRSMLRRVPKALGATNLTANMRLSTKAAVKIAGAKKTDERQLSCRLPAGVRTVALYTLDSAEALDRLAQSIKAMWDKAVKEA